MSTIELGPLSLWEIPEDYPSLLDHELIVLRWEDMGYDLSRSEDGTPTGRDIASLISAPDKLENAQKDWTSRSHTRKILDTTSSIKNLDDEVDWFEKTLSVVLDAHAKVLRVTSFSKRWWNKEVSEARRVWAKEKKKWEKVTPDAAKFKQARNLFYRIIRKTKREYWQRFLQGGEEQENITDAPKIPVKDRCWTALRYTSPR